jgi:lactaldehyde dehydrogenase/glycolaldehyde dehydrogenase
LKTSIEENTLYVGGGWCAASGDPIDVLNPATEETLGSIPSATLTNVEAALAAARAAQREWARMPAVERSSYLRGLADLLTAHRVQLAHLLVSEVGKPLSRAFGEVDWAVTYLRYSAEWARRIEGEIVPSDNRDEVIHLVRVPLGVVGAITAWNYPLALYARKVGPALVAGNTVVLKPSETTPLTTIEVARLIDESLDLPPGVLNLITGGPETGRALVASQDVDMITMTGHRDTGKQIMADAAQNLTRVALELGGKAPAIVLEDADVPRAVEAIITARHENSGQVCTCAERIYVHARVAEPFIDQYTAAASRLRLGNPLGDVDMGPLVSAEQHEKAQAAVALACDEGARVALGGGRPKGDDFARGYWFEPTVLLDVVPNMQVLREETFGPVTPITLVGSTEEAFAYANDSRYGLSAYVFTRDYQTAMRAAQEVSCGELYVNRSLGEQVQAYHSGHRESGFGGEDGKWGVLKYTQIRSVYHSFG